MTQMLTTEELAERWGRQTRWITLSARAGDIPGAWKLGHLWRFSLSEIEAYELAQQAQSIFALSDGAAKRHEKNSRA